MADEEVNQAGQNPDVYLRHRELLVTGDLQQSLAYDKHILTLASGALGLTRLFVDKIAQKPVCWTFLLLIITWVSFAFSILSTLISYKTSQRAYRENCDNWDKFEAGKTAADEVSDSSSWSKATSILNVLSMCLFVVGMFSFIIFASCNIHISHG